MRSLRVIQFLLLAAVVALGFGGTAWALHDGGVANCSACHSIHNSPAGALHLTVQGDDGSTCLRCHERTGDTGPTSYHISTPASELTTTATIPKQMTPGGDFGWLRQTFTSTASYGAPISNPGLNRGHNIQAKDNNYTQTDGTAPGGSMNSADLDCTSCHDPHSRARRLPSGAIQYPPNTGTYPPITESGSYGHIPGAGEAAGVYRLLGSSGYINPTNPAPFPGNPAAVVPSTYNKKETTPAEQVKVAYGYGTTSGYASWSAWCGTCHPDMHTAPTGRLVHKTEDQLGSSISLIYNRYVKTGDMTGDPNTSFTSLVPFAVSSTDPAVLEAASADTLAGPGAGDRIACLSCHRAHASAWRYALRWNNEAEFMTLGDGGVARYPGIDVANSADPNLPFGNEGQFNRGYTEAQMQAAYYDRPATTFAPYQRVLCNKCHNKD